LFKIIISSIDKYVYIRNEFLVGRPSKEQKELTAWIIDVMSCEIEERICPGVQCSKLEAAEEARKQARSPGPGQQAPQGQATPPADLGPLPVPNGGFEGTE